MRTGRLGRETASTWLRVVAMAGGWTLVTVIGLSALGLVTSDAAFLGASDERIETIAIDTYAAFLRRVALAMAEVAAVEWLFLSAVTVGLLFLLGRKLPRLRSRRVRRHVIAFAVALLVTTAFWGFGAQRHPGLFLGVLANSRATSLWAESCVYLAPALLAASIFGFLSGAARATAGVQLTAIALAAAVGAACGRTNAWARRYQPEPFALRDIPNPARVPATYPLSPSASAAAEASAAALAASASAASAAASGPTPKPARPIQAERSTNILWLAIDSLRPDMIDPVSTPNLAALISQSIYFPNTIVPVPRTGPSWAAALTSLDPLTTGIETMFPDAKRANLSTVALPAYLASRGYRTMVASEYAGEFFRRVKVGFEVEAVPRAELMQISGQILMSRAPVVLAQAGLMYGAGPGWRELLPYPLGELIRGMPNFSAPETLGEDVTSFLRKDATPAFVLAFYSQPHFPYTSSPAFAKRFHVSGSSPALAYGRDVTNEKPITTEADRKQVQALYRAALAESDAAAGKLLAALEKSGWLDDAIVVLTADHGEGLYECAECVGHGDNLRGMITLRVPLAIRLPPKRFPAAKPSLESSYVSLLDVYPTLVDLLGLPKIVVQDGLPLLTSEGTPKPMPPRTHIVETGEWLWTTAAVPKDRIEYPPITELAQLEGDTIAIDPKYEGVIRAAKHRAAIRAPYKLLYEPSRSGVRWRLFDFEKDPFDTNDLAASEPQVLAELREALRRSVLRHSRVIPVGDFFLTRPPNPHEEHW